MFLVLMAEHYVQIIPVTLPILVVSSLSIVCLVIGGVGLRVQLVELELILL
jgi:hypothetical protein